MSDGGEDGGEGVRLTAQWGPVIFKSKWALRMIRIAEGVALWSNCTAGRQHGCVLAAQGRFIVATGYNGPSSTRQVELSKHSDNLCPCYGKERAWCAANCPAVHAETNAVLNAARVGARLPDCVAYVTKLPCDRCMAMLENSVLAICWKVNADAPAVQGQLLMRAASDPRIWSL